MSGGHFAQRRGTVRVILVENFCEIILHLDQQLISVCHFKNPMFSSGGRFV